KHMETNKCKKCQQIIAGDIHRISITDTEVRSGKSNVKYENYCQSCYEKLPVGVRPYDCKGNDKCQSCGVAKECSSKKCNNNANRLCSDCRVSNKEEWDGLLNCNYCSRRVKTLFTSSGQAGGDMCADCYAGKCKKCGSSTKGNPEGESNKCPECGALGGCRGLCSMLRSRRNADEYREFTDWLNKNKIPELVAESKAENLKLVAEEYHKEINYQGDVDTEIAICHAKHVQNCQSASLSDRSKANAAFDKQNYDGFYFTDDKSGNKSRESGNPNNHQKGNGGLVKGILM
ncbi:9565_t:CDS:2, partial [Racocetra persica]